MHQEKGDEAYDAPEGGGSIRETIVTLAVAIGLAFVVQAYLVKPYRIPSGSMKHTLECRDRVLVDRITGHFDEPERFDVLVFNPPAGRGEDGRPDPAVVDDSGGPNGSKGTKTRSSHVYIKRVIGLPGEKLQVRDGRAWINGKKLDEPFVHPGAEDDLDDREVSVTIPDDRYYMLGDNRDHSADSRVWGPLPTSYVIGKAFMIYWPPGHFGPLPDETPEELRDVDDDTSDPKCIDDPGLS